MVVPEILVGSRGGKEYRPVPDAPWHILGWVGKLFLVVGGIDVALVWYPANFGSPEFEFASVSASLNSLPVVTIGLALVVASAAALGQRWSAWLAAAVAGLGLAFVLIGAVLFALTVPLALQAPVDDVIRVGIQKQVAKGSVQVLAYGLVYGVIARWAIRVAKGA